MFHRDDQVRFRGAEQHVAKSCRWAKAFKMYFVQAIVVSAERVRVASVMRRADS